jgi:hypothetical protein
MKTTKKSVLVKKVNRLVEAKKLSKSSLVYGWVLNMKHNDVLRPVYSQGSSWKHSSLVDKNTELTTLLSTLGIKFETGNDAPKGGKTGAYVKIITKIID